MSVGTLLNRLLNGHENVTTVSFANETSAQSAYNLLYIATAKLNLPQYNCILLGDRCWLKVENLSLDQKKEASQRVALQINRLVNDLTEKWVKFSQQTVIRYGIEEKHLVLYKDGREGMLPLFNHSFVKLEEDLTAKAPKFSASKNDMSHDAVLSITVRDDRLNIHGLDQDIEAFFAISTPFTLFTSFVKKMGSSQEIRDDFNDPIASKAVRCLLLAALNQTQLKANYRCEIGSDERLCFKKISLSSDPITKDQILLLASGESLFRSFTNLNNWSQKPNNQKEEKETYRFNFTVNPNVFDLVNFMNLEFSKNESYEYSTQKCPNSMEIKQKHKNERFSVIDLCLNDDQLRIQGSESMINHLFQTIKNEFLIPVNP